MHARLEIKIKFASAIFFACLAFSCFIPTPTHAQSCNTNGDRVDDSDGSIIQANDPSCAVANATNQQLTQNQQLSNQGIFGCLGAGAQVGNQARANVGTTRAIGGVYVPVNDAAVTLNTGFLVYKECILDGMARNIAQNVSAQYLKEQVQQFNTGRNGNAQYVRNIREELIEDRKELYAYELSDTALGSMCGAFRQPVRGAIIRGLLSETNSPGSIYTCPFTGGGGFYSNWFAATSPTGNIFSIAAVTRGNLANRAAEREFNLRQMWDWGDGVYSTENDAPNPLARTILTPGFIIAQAIAQATGSGFRQLENANEIDQIVTNLFAGLTTRLVGSASGVPGLFVSSGTQPAYIDRMVAQTQAAVRTGAVNAAAVTSSSYRQGEAAYLEAKQGTATALLNIITQLRSVENQCWNLIIPAVQTHAQSNGSPTLIIATSTQFSQAVIDSPANNIRSLASTTAAEVLASQQALQQLDQLTAIITSGTSTAAQQQALVQLDQMFANNRLHTSQQAQAAIDQRSAITSALTTLLNDTKTAWADSPDVNIGWCNINNPAVVTRWFDAWRQ